MNAVIEEEPPDFRRFATTTLVKRGLAKQSVEKWMSGRRSGAARMAVGLVRRRAKGNSAPNVAAAGTVPGWGQPRSRPVRPERCVVATQDNQISSNVKAEIYVLNASGASLLLAFKSWSDLHFSTDSWKADACKGLKNRRPRAEARRSSPGWHQ